MKRTIAAGTAVAPGACGVPADRAVERATRRQQAADAPAPDRAAPAPPRRRCEAPPDRERPSCPTTATPLPEPSGPIDPKSAEAAGQVVQHYGALIEQRPLRRGAKLLGRRARAASIRPRAPGLRRSPPRDRQAGEPEGAAGSIYITVPVVFYGKRKGGSPSHGETSSCAGSTTCRARPKRSGAGTSSGSSGRRPRSC